MPSPKWKSQEDGEQGCFGHICLLGSWHREGNQHRFAQQMNAQPLQGRAAGRPLCRQPGEGWRNPESLDALLFPSQDELQPLIEQQGLRKQGNRIHRELDSDWCTRGRRWGARKRQHTVAGLTDSQDDGAISREARDKSAGRCALGRLARRWKPRDRNWGLPRPERSPRYPGVGTAPWICNLAYSLSVWGSPGGAVIKNLPANTGDERDAGSILGQEDPLGKEMATHFSILAWRIPWTEEPGGLQSMGSQRVRHNWSNWPHSLSSPLDLRHPSFRTAFWDSPVTPENISVFCVVTFCVCRGGYMAVSEWSQSAWLSDPEKINQPLCFLVSSSLN